MEDLGPGARGMHVRLAQRLLNRALRQAPGFHRLVDDGIYGRRTEAAVQLLQDRSHVSSTEHGYVGPSTWRLMGLTVQIEHTVTLVPQHYLNGCWSASASMVMGVEMSVSPGSANLILPDNPNDPVWGQLGADNANIIAFAEHINGRAVVVPATVERIATYLRIRPIWIAGHWAQGGGHVVVISALWGDGTNEGSVIRIHDPWPVNEGNIYGTVWPAMRCPTDRFLPFALGVGI
ncbi:hypothetical protein sos41_03180 [Alphaproteobacteria bacterium SO-S41]|nr:hypothetical protein sos41_03180 [Alphaproteobacteria bacterium SO-S41]